MYMRANTKELYVNNWYNLRVFLYGRTSQKSEGIILRFASINFAALPPGFTVTPCERNPYPLAACTDPIVKRVYTYFTIVTYASKKNGKGKLESITITNPQVVTPDIHYMDKRLIRLSCQIEKPFAINLCLSPSLWYLLIFDRKIHLLYPQKWRACARSCESGWKILLF